MTRGDFLKSVAEREGVSVSTLRRWEKRGVDLEDPLAIEKFRRELKPPTQEERAEKLGVSLRTVQRLEAEGIDTRDEDLVASMTEGAEPEGLTEARVRKTNLESERLQIIIDRERGALVAKEWHDDQMFKVGSFMRTLIIGLQDELPPMMEGLTAGQMKKRLGEWGLAKLEELSGVGRDGD